MGNVSHIDFKSVGIRTEENNTSTRALDGRPIGIRTPMSLGQGDSIFTMNYSIKDQIKQNFRNMLLTNHGERLGLYNFGANLRPLSLELGSEEFDSEAAIRIKTATSKWLPFINLIEMQRNVDNTDNEHVAKIKIRIFYSVPRLGIERDAIEITFFVGA